MENRTVSLSSDEIRTLMEQAVEQAFKKIGVDVANPLDMQHDMAYLRVIRETAEQAKSVAVKILISTIVVAAIGSLWIGFVDSIKGHLPPYK